MFRVINRLHYRLLCAILIPVLLQTGLWWYLSLSVATPSARQQAARSLTDAVSSAGARVDGTMTTMDGMSLQIVADTQVQDALRHEASGDAMVTVDSRAVNDTIARTLAWTDVPIQIGVLGPRGRRYGEPLAMNWRTDVDPQFGAAEAARGQTSPVGWTAPYANLNPNNVSGGPWIAAVRPVPDETGGTIGIVVTELPVQQLGLQLPDGPSDPHLALALLASDGAIISGGAYGVPGLQILAQRPMSTAGAWRDGVIAWRGTTYVVVSSPLRHARWRVVGLIPWNDANLIVAGIERTVGVAAVVEVCLAIALAWIIATWLDRPLQRLLAGIRQVREGHWAARVPVTPPDEIAELSASFNAMAEQIQGAMASLRETQQRELHARLEMLSGEINAHFLFNALEVIDCVAFKEGPEAVTRVVTALGRLLRYTLDERQDDVTLADEVRQAESYLLIQSERFEERLSYRIEVDAALHDGLVPRFSLQPLIENAIKHGVYPAHSPCTIVVRAHAQGGELFVDVEDDGAGMPPARVAALRASLRNDGATALGIGLLNVHRRLYLQCGADAGLEIQTPTHGGTIVRLRLPLVRRREYHDYQEQEEDADVSLAHRRR